MKLAAFCTLGLIVAVGCTPEKRSPDAIRRDTAAATAEAARDAKAVAQGVVEGLKEKGPININRATADQLKTLPGIDDATAHRIVAGRPYQDASELHRRHLITKAEYDRIADKVVAR
jgi:DNA uptake protein ComE-like DNA-binding protein